MNTLNDISTDEIRKNWAKYKDTIQELELFELIWYSWFKKNNVYNSSELGVLKDFIMEIKKVDKGNFFKYDEKTLTITTEHIKNDLINFIKKMMTILKNIGLHNEFKIQNNSIIICIYKQPSWRWEYSETNPYNNEEIYNDFIQKRNLLPINPKRRNNYSY